MDYVLLVSFLKYIVDRKQEEMSKEKIHNRSSKYQSKYSSYVSKIFCDFVVLDKASPILNSLLPRHERLLWHGPY
jgi:hypothetical protein